MLTICNAWFNVISVCLQIVMFFDRQLFELDRRLGLRKAGLLAGAAFGGIYTAESAGHMVVRSATDTILVCVLLVALGAVLGWLAGALLRSAIVRPAGSGDAE